MPAFGVPESEQVGYVLTHTRNESEDAVRAPDASSVLFSESALDRFLAAAVREYANITENDPVPCFAVLLGTAADGDWLVHDVAFGRNARTTDPNARQEFAATIVPRFGAAYENPVRAWWLDPADLLRIAREADRRNLDILGSVHMHPDWHRLGPRQARAHPLDECPTEMDRYVFRSSGWPVNVVCYVERRHGAHGYALSAWDAECRRLALRVHRPATGGVLPGDGGRDD
ncbi:hypothetical protein EES43_28765 [Streptomyces sp. ADI96-02]|uniref:hypothetical protein n=1 Tax=Streptomyces sp. ADI96-02 TaxID=1522760 RepID=UPI000FB047C3|nr:hypothetical protein [Streptomyces sp. ADI96-02]RPK54569.1 hypothetical protein EES43_28765 [Streptomyces sp. ADI96-02]